MDQKDIRQRETEGKETAVLLKRLRVSAVFHALLVLLGAFVTQFVASMLCMIVTGVRHPVLPLDLEGAAVFLPEGL